MSETDPNQSTAMDPHRLESLTDGIFAFAMTLLLSFFFSGWSSLAYWLIPLAMLMPRPKK